jgi:hypothetical protein
MGGPTFTLDIGTLAVLLLNTVGLAGAYYSLTTAISLVKSAIAAIHNDLVEIKKNAQDRGKQLDRVDKAVAILSDRSDHELKAG